MTFQHEKRIKVAAIQMESIIGDIKANLTMCENLANDAAERGAEWIILPEFFTTGMAYDEQIFKGALPPDGVALQLLIDISKRHNVITGGSFLCRDKDGHVRNAFYLVSPNGVIGRHNKDLPTMWENCFFIGGSDDGIIDYGNINIGAAVCWEYMRTETARRLRGKVDIIVGGSCWWSIPNWQPKGIMANLERKNANTAFNCVVDFPSLVGAPIIHSTHCGNFKCKMPLVPFKYSGHYEGGALIADQSGEIIAIRKKEAGPGVVIGDVHLKNSSPTKQLPTSYWLHNRDPLTSIAWHYQRWHGKLMYRKKMVSN